MEGDVAAQIADLLSRTHRHTRRRAERELGQAGVTPSQARALRGLSGGPVRISTLARWLDVVPRSATSVVDELEAAGFVARRPDPGDRRATLVALTDRGAEVLADLRKRKRYGMAAILDRLDDHEQQELVRLLAKLSGSGSEVD